MRRPTILALGMMLTAAAATAQTPPAWQVILEEQMLSESGCRVEYLTGVRETGEGDDARISARVHCSDQRAFDVERAKPHLKFEVEECPNNFC